MPPGKRASLGVQGRNDVLRVADIKLAVDKERRGFVTPACVISGSVVVGRRGRVGGSPGASIVSRGVIAGLSSGPARVAELADAEGLNPSAPRGV